MASQCIIAPKPVKLSSQYANDLDEAEQATLSKPIVQFEETTTSRPFPEKRTLSNASSTTSNATTLVDEHEQEELSPTQTQSFRDDGNSTESYLLEISVLTVFRRFSARNPLHKIERICFDDQLPKSEASG